MRTRNWRLAAIHSLFGYAALHHPEHAAVIQRVLAIPAKRHERSTAHLAHRRQRSTPCWPHPTGARGPAGVITPCSSLAVQTGLRISELIGLSHGDVVLDAGAHVRCMGKGRKERATPLTGLTVAVLRGLAHREPGSGP